MEHNHTQHEHHAHPHHGKSNNLAIPVAIVIAGTIIALAIFFSGRNDATQPTKVAGMTIESASKSVKVSYKDVQSCMQKDTYKSKIEASSKEAQSAGGSGTPWSVVVTKSGNKYVLSGAQPIERVKALIDQALKDELATSDAKLDKISPVSAADHIRGDINAPVKIIQYSDIDCPFCKRFHGTMQEVMDSYGKDGKVAWVMRHFPLTQLHPDAFNKAEASECVAELGGNDKFWKFVDTLSK